MAINVKKSDKNNEIKYPCLGIYPDGMIVLFTDFNRGTLMCRKECFDNTLEVGSHANNWKSNWVPYTGTITLTNY